MGLRHTIARNLAASYLGFGVSSLVTLLLTPFLIHRLDATHFGVWVLLKTVLSYFQLLELGIVPAVVRYVSLHKERDERGQVDRVLGGAMQMMVVVSLVTVPVVALSAHYGPRLFNLPEGLAPIFAQGTWLVGAAAIIAYFRRLLIATLQGYQRYDLLNACNIGSTLLSAAATVWFVLRGYGILTLIVILVGRTLVEGLVELWIVRRVLGLAPNPFRTHADAVRKLTGYSLYAWLVDLAVSISYRIDVMVLGIFQPVVAITHYEIATRISGALEKITGPLIGMFFPMASAFESAQRPEALRKLLLAGTRATVLMITPGLLLLAVYGGDVIGWWVGPEYVDACWPVLLIFLGVVLMAVFDSTAGRILLGTGNVRFDAGISAANATVNLVLSLILVQRFGVVGVSIGTLIPATLGTLFVSVPYVCRVTGTAVVSFYMRVFTPVLAVAAVSLVFMGFTSLWLDNRVLSLAVDATFVCAVTGFIFIRFVRRLAAQDRAASVAPAAKDTPPSRSRARIDSRLYEPAHGSITDPRKRIANELRPTVALRSRSCRVRRRRRMY